MEFALQIGDKYLTDIDSSGYNAGQISGHTVFTYSPDGTTLNLEDKPKYYSHQTIKTWTREVIELMRWGDIPLDLIKIIPEEELDD